MIRLTWRQFRTQATVALAALVVIAVALALNPVTGVTPVSGPAGTGLLNNLLQNVGTLLLAVPAIIGIFWGAPLVASELESGTFRLAWTQSVTRTRWLATKLVLVGLASMAAAGLLSLMVTWWFSPIPSAHTSPFASFDKRDIVAIGYAAFAFALGVLSGTLIRRTLPAMVTTLVAFVAVRLAFNSWVRPNLMAPLHITAPFRMPRNGADVPGNGLTKPSDWILSDHTINAAGKVIGQNGGIDFVANAPGGPVSLQGVGVCPNIYVGSGKPNREAFQACLNHYGIRQAVTYQPASRYWTFQAYETAIFLGLALLLIGFCYWRITRPDRPLLGISVVLPAPFGPR
jgi:hypothetical protein